MVFARFRWFGVLKPPHRVPRVYNRTYALEGLGAAAPLPNIPFATGARGFAVRTSSKRTMLAGLQPSKPPTQKVIA
jgi:hypothetical protein